MGMVFVTGIPESGRDEIVEMVLTGSKKNLPEFDYFRFDDIASYEVDSSSGMVDLWSFSDRIGRMHSIQRDFHTRLRKKVENLKLKGNHIIANGYFTFSTPGGYLPLLSRGSERFFRPDVILVLEIDFRNPLMIKKLGRERMEQLKYDQDINLKCAANYALLARSAISIVHVEYGNIKGALKDVTDVLTLALG